jgi:hypothetical protein
MMNSQAIAAFRATGLTDIVVLSRVVNINGLRRPTADSDVSGRAAVSGSSDQLDRVAMGHLRTGVYKRSAMGATTSQVGIPPATRSATSRKKFSKPTGLMTSIMRAGTRAPAETDLALPHTRTLVFAGVSMRRAREGRPRLVAARSIEGKPDSS